MQHFVQHIFRLPRFRLPVDQVLHCDRPQGLADVSQRRPDDGGPDVVPDVGNVPGLVLARAPYPAAHPALCPPNEAPGAREPVVRGADVHAAVVIAVFPRMMAGDGDSQGPRAGTLKLRVVPSGPARVSGVSDARRSLRTIVLDWSRHCGRGRGPPGAGGGDG